MDWNAIWNTIWSMNTLMIILDFLFIFFAKIIEVSIGTLRNILVVKGYRKVAVILALVEIMIWVFVASQVITGLAEKPYKGIAYGLGFAAGVYVGSILEEKLAFGKILIQVITSEESGQIITQALRRRKKTSIDDLRQPSWQQRYQQRYSSHRSDSNDRPE